MSELQLGWLISIKISIGFPIDINIYQRLMEYRVKNAFWWKCKIYEKGVNAARDGAKMWNRHKNTLLSKNIKNRDEWEELTEWKSI